MDQELDQAVTTKTQPQPSLDEALARLEDDVFLFALGMEHLEPSHFQINTMTLVCRDAIAECKIHHLYDFFTQLPLTDSDTYSIKSGRGFGASTTVSYQGKQSIKYFKRSSLFHLTGFKTVANATRALEPMVGGFLDPEHTWEPYMIHASCNLNASVQLEGCFLRISKEKNSLQSIQSIQSIQSLDYNPENHPGLLFRWRDVKCTTIVFSTGKVLFMGAKHPEAIYKSYCHLITCLDQYPECFTKTSIQEQEQKNMQSRIPKKRGRKRKETHDAFYTDMAKRICI